MVQTAALPPLVRGKWYAMSWEEFLVWAPDEGQAEWVDGEGIAYVSTSTRHGDLLEFFASLLGLYLRVFGLGRLYNSQILLRLPARPSGRMPDILVVPQDRLDQIRHQWVENAALFVAEFISEDSVERDLIEKRFEFQQAGFPEYLAVDARLDHDDVIFLRLDDRGEYQPVEPDEEGRYHSRALPGFWFHPSWFSQVPRPDVEDLMLEIAPDAYEAWITAKLQAKRRRRGTR
jgi:Uma2 family endonuclease